MDPIAEWKTLPGLIETAVAGASEASLDEQVGPESLGMTRRQLVHHVAEANVVAASIILAALGSPGCTYDWSWMMPFGPWLERLDYAHKPIQPSLRLLGALNDYMAAQLQPLRDGLAREVWLRDAPGADLRRVTVASLLRQEIDHAREHLGQLAPAPS
jgi:hypothetical protein